VGKAFPNLGDQIVAEKFIGSIPRYLVDRRVIGVLGGLIGVLMGEPHLLTTLTASTR
jgi:hypothetical protein